MRVTGLAGRSGLPPLRGTLLPYVSDSIIIHTMSEGEPSLSPRIRAVLDSCHAGVKREFYWLDSLSCLDSYTDSFADWIDPPELAPQVTGPRGGHRGAQMRVRRRGTLLPGLDEWRGVAPPHLALSSANCV